MYGTMHSAIGLESSPGRADRHTDASTPAQETFSSDSRPRRNSLNTVQHPSATALSGAAPAAINTAEPTPSKVTNAATPASSSSVRKGIFSVFGQCRPNAAAVVAALIAWIHGWMSGLTHSEPLLDSANGIFKIYAMAFGLLCLVCWGHPVARRVVCAGAFALSMVFLMAVTSSIAWFRNPKHAGHLPDLVHDLVPSIDNVTLPLIHRVLGREEPVVIGGLECAESLMSGLVIVTLVWSMTQPSRWLILRRAMVIYGTLALWRSVTIIVTAVPDASPRCSPTTPGTVHFLEMPWKDALSRGIAIVVGEMSDPCRSAGDMVFSGHSMVVVLCGMVWHAYYRVKPGTFVPNPVKMMIWAVICVILFLIVAARYHYTLDVVLAIYFAVTIFNAYHRIADDILIGHRFVAVWLFDGLLIYPAIEWLEAPHLREAANAGMISRNTQLMKQLQDAKLALREAHIPTPPTPAAMEYTPAGTTPETEDANVGLHGVLSPPPFLHKARPRSVTGGSQAVGVVYAVRSIFNADGNFHQEPFDAPLLYWGPPNTAAQARPSDATSVNSPS